MTITFNSPDLLAQREFFIPSPKSVNGITLDLDPQPDWSFDSLLQELTSIEDKLNEKSMPFRKLGPRESPASRGSNRKSGGFMMHFSDDEIELDSEDDDKTQQQLVAAGHRFACDELYLSDSEDSENANSLGIQSHLMEPAGLVEGALAEITHEHQLSVMEEMRIRVSAMEADLINENEKFVSTLAQIDKSVETKQAMDRKLDMQYQRKIAEALDSHLTAVQRDHEHRSQIEERRIRDAAAREEARRTEKALQEEKVRQEKLKAETERLAELEAERVETEKVAAKEEAERTAAREAAVKNASQKSVEAASLESSGPPIASQSNAAGNTVRGAENALRLEEQRLRTLKELTALNETLGIGTNKLIARTIKQISWTKGSVSKAARTLLDALNNPSTPQPVSIVTFAEKFVLNCEKSKDFDNKLNACARVIVSVTSQFPQAMEILIAELNRVCIFTVPKYISYSESAFDSREAHLKAIGYREKDKEIDTFLDRVKAYMQLYGALVQIESFEGCQNSHGLVEGWSWLSRFLNALPANVYTATALQAFLQMAGFALYRRYKSQFAKLLQIIEYDFLRSLKDQGDSRNATVIISIQNYLDSRQHLKEPEGLQVREELESSDYVLTIQNNYQSNQNQNHSNQNYYQSNQNYSRSNQNYYQSNRYS